MDALTCNLNGPLSVQCHSEPDLDRYFATPALWLPGMDEAEWQDELRKMINRSMAVSDFVSGRISPDDFMDILHDNGVDVFSASADWDSGICYL